jgi:hypothetical protein
MEIEEFDELANFLEKEKSNVRLNSEINLYVNKNVTFC